LGGTESGRMRFSLRTLMLVVTYAAVSMGLLAVVYVQSPSKWWGMLVVGVMWGDLIVVFHSVWPQK
jgi:hypothetical protein